MTSGSASAGERSRWCWGPRSAIFAPLKDVGLIVLDEEQESSYQSENPPRYHTRDVAKYLCARDGAVLVLGSATPSVETAWNAEQGNYHRALLAAALQPAEPAGGNRS